MRRDHAAGWLALTALLFLWPAGAMGEGCGNGTVKDMFDPAKGGPPLGGTAIAPEVFDGYSHGPRFRFWPSQNDLGPWRVQDSFKPVTVFGYTPRIWLLASGRDQADVAALAGVVGSDNMNYLDGFQSALDNLAALVDPSRRVNPVVMIDAYHIMDELDAAVRAAHGVGLAADERVHASYWMRVDAVEAERITLRAHLENAGRPDLSPVSAEVGRDKFRQAWESVDQASPVPVKWGPCYAFAPAVATAPGTAEQIAGFGPLVADATAAPGSIRRLAAALLAGVEAGFVRAGHRVVFGPGEAVYLQDRLVKARQGTAAALRLMGFAQLAPAYDQLAADWGGLSAAPDNAALADFLLIMAEREDAAMAAMLNQPALAGNTLGGRVVSTADPSGMFVQLTTGPDPTSSIAATTHVRNPQGQFGFAQVALGVYHLIAWRDTNFNDRYDPGEPLGAYQGLVDLSRGGSLDGLDISLP